MQKDFELQDMSGIPPTPSILGPDKSGSPSLSDLEVKSDKVAQGKLTQMPPVGEWDLDFDAEQLSPPLASEADKTNKQIAIVVGEAPPLEAVQVDVKEVPIDVKDIEEIRELLENKAGDLSTQQLLSEALKKISDLNLEGCKAEIVSTLKGSPRPEVETFSVPSAPGEAYYKIGVTYQIKVTKDGKDVKGFEKLDIEREIYTTSKTPEGAIFAANDFKRTVVELAKAHSDPAYKGIEFDDKKKDDVMKQKSFKFNYVYNAEGKPTALQSIQADNKEKTELKVKADPDAKEFAYYRDLKTQELHRIKKSDAAATFTGQAIYGTEEEALLNTPYVIKDDSPYERIASGKTFDQQIGAIKEEIKKREAEMHEIKSAFIKQPRLKLFSSPHETVEFKQLQANLAYEKAEKDGKKVPPEDMKMLSPAKQKEIELAKQAEELSKLEKLVKQLDEKLDSNPSYQIPTDDEKSKKVLKFIEKMTDQYKDKPEVKGKPLIAQLHACLKFKQQESKDLASELSSAKDAVNLEKRKMNDAIVKFQNANLVLQSNLELLIKIKQGASDKAKEPTATEESRQIAENIGKSISDKEIDDLRATIEENKKFLAKIEPKVTP